MRARRTTALLLAALLPLALAACGVGRDPQTYKERTTTDAANANVGNLALRDIAIQPPADGTSELAAGSDALATLTIVSSGTDGDTLSSVSSPAATSVQIVDQTGHSSTSVAIPPLGSVGPADFGLVLHGLTAPLRPGLYATLTFVFDHNGTQTVEVPVKVFRDPLPRDSYSPPPASE